MPRKKDDFLNYANSFRTRTATAEQRSGIPSIEGDSSSFDAGNAHSVTDVYTTNVGYDESTQDAGSAATGIQRSDENDSRHESGEDGGNAGFDNSWHGYDGANGNSDWTTGERYGSTDYYDKPIQPGVPTVRNVTRTRKSFMDRVISGTSRAINQREPKAKDKPLVRDSISGRKLLTLAEVSATKMGLIQLLLWSSENLDHGLTAITRGHREVEIWSNLEYADAEILVESFADAAQKSERVARAYRQVVDYSKKIKVGVILAPRIYRSIVYVITTGIDLRLE